MSTIDSNWNLSFSLNFEDMQMQESRKKLRIGKGKWENTDPSFQFGGRDWYISKGRYVVCGLCRRRKKSTSLSTAYFLKARPLMNLVLKKKYQPQIVTTPDARISPLLTFLEFNELDFLVDISKIQIFLKKDLSWYVSKLRKRPRI